MRLLWLIDKTHLSGIVILYFILTALYGCAGYVSPVHEVRMHYQAGEKEKLAEYVNNSDPEAREEAVFLLSKMGECSPKLYNFSRDVNLKVRAAVAKNLQSCNSEEAQRVLMKLLRDDSPLVRKYAVESIILNDYCKGDCFFAARKLLEDADSYVKLSAAKALYKRFPEEARSAVIDCLSSRIFTIKKEAVESLSLFKNPEDIHYLKEFLQKDDESLRIAARKSIENILGKSLSGSDYNQLISGDKLAQDIKHEKVTVRPVTIHESSISKTTSVLSDMGISKQSHVDKDAIAVIIGNRDYASVDIPRVDYALRDAQLMKEVARNILGVPSENIIYIENGKTSDFIKIFGSSQNPKGLLYNWSNSNSKVFIYYSGHGTPDVKNGDAYFVPVDSDINYIDLSGYPLKQLYKNLETLNAQSITVIIDACFSGVSHAGTITKSASPIFVQVSNPYTAANSKMTVITSSKADEISTWDNEHAYGLFTYHFVKSLNEAETNNDGTITITQIEKYISQKVPYYARRLMNRDQNPQVIGPKNAVLIQFK